jgi:hypothetical protein
MSSELFAVKGKGDVFFLKVPRARKSKLKFQPCMPTSALPHNHINTTSQFNLIAAAELQMYESVVV